MTSSNELYSFVYRGILAEESLDKAGRVTRQIFGAQEAGRLHEALAFDMLDADHLANAQRMAVVYTSVHAFENTVRELVQRAMAEHYGEDWWSKVPERIRKKVTSRMEEDAKFRYHTSRGGSEIMYADFRDLSSIITSNWTVFEDILVDLNWLKALLDTLEKSRNIVMHGGVLAQEDIERIGMNLRDWIRQTG